MTTPRKLPIEEFRELVVKYDNTSANMIIPKIAKSKTPLEELCEIIENPTNRTVSTVGLENCSILIHHNDYISFCRNFKTNVKDSDIESVKLEIGGNPFDEIKGELMSFLRKELNMEDGTIPFHMMKTGLLNEHQDIQLKFILKKSCETLSLTYDEYHVPDHFVPKLETFFQPVVLNSTNLNSYLGIYYVFAQEVLDVLKLETADFCSEIEVYEKTKNYSIFKFGNPLETSKFMPLRNVKFSCEKYELLQHNVIMYNHGSSIPRYSS